MDPEEGGHHPPLVLPAFYVRPLSRSGCIHGVGVDGGVGGGGVVWE